MVYMVGNKDYFTLLYFIRKMDDNMDNNIATWTIT